MRALAITGARGDGVLGVTGRSQDLAFGSGGTGIVFRPVGTDLLDAPSLRETGSFSLIVGLNLCLLALRVTMVLFG